MRRLMAYSHDTYGLGNIRRMLSVCNHLVDAIPDLSILLVSGSPMVHSFRVKNGIDYIKLPCLTRREAEDYGVKTIGTDLTETVALRSELILRTANRFSPDLLLVDKKPYGVEHELRATLNYLHTNRPQTKLALLLRDVLDSAAVTTAVWKKNRYYEAVRKFYDLVLVVGLPAVFDLRKEYSFPYSVSEKVRFCGYIGRHNGAPRGQRLRQDLNLQTDKLVLVTVGGGEDGYELLRNYLAGLARRIAAPNFDSLIVCGPEMAPSRRTEVQRLATACAQVQVREFLDDMIGHMDAADAVVSMGGYNTICELLSLRKPAVIVPRVKPVAEQWIRAQRIANVGLFTVIHPDFLTPANLSSAVDELVRRSSANVSLPSIDLEALPQIAGYVDSLLNQPVPQKPARRAAQELHLA